MVNATQRKRIMSSPAMMMAIMNFMAFLICFLELPPVGEGASPTGGLLSVWDFIPSTCYFMLSTNLKSLLHLIPENPLWSGSLDHQMNIGLPTMWSSGTNPQ